MTDKKVISVCPTGHEKWYKQLTEKFEKDPFNNFFDLLNKKKFKPLVKPTPTKLANAISDIVYKVPLLDLIQKQITNKVEKEMVASIETDYDDFFNKPKQYVYMETPALGKRIINTLGSNFNNGAIKYAEKLGTVMSQTEKDPSFFLNVTKRREEICKIHHVCPACHAVQVQLVSWFDPIITRKCRICKHVHREFIPME